MPDLVAAFEPVALTHTHRARPRSPVGDDSRRVRRHLQVADPPPSVRAMTPPRSGAPSGRATERGNAARPPRCGRCSTGSARVYDPMNLVISGVPGATLADGASWPPRRARARRQGDRRGDGDRQGRRGPPAQRVGPSGDGARESTSRPGMIRIARRDSRDRPGARVRRRRRDGPAGARTTTFDAATIALRHAQPARLRARLRRDGPRRPAGWARWCASRSPGREAALARILRWWFDRIVPAHRAGGRSGRGATRYLVRSVRDYPAPERIAEIMREAGLVGRRLARHVRRDRHAPRRDRSGAGTARLGSASGVAFAAHAGDARALAHPCPRTDQAVR